MEECSSPLLVQTLFRSPNGQKSWVFRWKSFNPFLKHLTLCHFWLPVSKCDNPPAKNFFISTYLYKNIIYPFIRSAHSTTNLKYNQSSIVHRWIIIVIMISEVASTGHSEDSASLPEILKPGIHNNVYQQVFRFLRAFCLPRNNCFSTAKSIFHPFFENHLSCTIHMDANNRVLVDIMAET